MFHPEFNIPYRYSSRLSYAHTAAVVSMVGYVLGLGDRHGENILFDSTNGDCVHVDFNCLFNRVWIVKICIQVYMYHSMLHTYIERYNQSMIRSDSDWYIVVLR